MTATDQDRDELTHSLSRFHLPLLLWCHSQNGTFTLDAHRAGGSVRSRENGWGWQMGNSFTVAVSDGQDNHHDDGGDRADRRPAISRGRVLWGGLGVTPSGVAVVGNRPYVANQGSVFGCGVRHERADCGAGEDDRMVAPG